jgi:CHAT domain-containing protein/Tfp pilus assembly protein PilF
MTRAARRVSLAVGLGLTLVAVFALRLRNVSGVDPAIAELEEAVAEARRSHDPLLLSRAANELSALQHRVGDLDAARALAEEALRASEDAGSAEQRAEAFYNIGYVDYSRGALREAIRHFERSAAAALQGGDTALVARAHLYLGMTATMMEQRESAEAALSKALELSRRAGDARGEADAARALGQLHSRLGDAQAALERFEQARRILSSLDDPATEATVLNGLGQVYFDLGEPESALRYYRQALELNERLRIRRREASTLLEIGRCELELGRGNEARERFLQALHIYRSLGNRRLEGEAHVELGRLQERLGEYDDAIDSFGRAIERKEESGDARGLAHLLEEVGSLHFERGAYEEALPHYRDAARLAGEASDPLGESLALYGVARAERELGRPQEALGAVERSLELVEGVRARVASHGLRTSLLASVHDRYGFYVDLLLQLGRETDAFRAAERARARTLVDSLSEAAAGIREGIDPELQAQERELSRKLNDAAREQSLLADDADREVSRALSEEVTELAADYDRLQSRIRAQSPRYSSLTQPHPSSLEEVQRSLLDEDTRLLAYSLGAERSFLWSATATGHEIHELPARSEIEDLARTVYLQLQSPRGDASTDVEKLSRILIDPIYGLADSKRIAVVADGALGSLPFAALLDPKGQRLLETLEVVRLPSASVLPSLREQRRGRTFAKRAAIAADPAYIGELPPLPQSRREALAIQALAPPGSVDVVTGYDANRDWVASSDFGAYRTLHFAAHALVDDEHPELSGIALSLVDENGASRDGFLRLHDVYNLRLPVDLVVLSACETALGKEVQGEGLVSLVRGFMYAGAPAVLASSWNVDDQATSELMQHFYRSYFGGNSAAAALREAQLALSRTKRFGAPYYWAAFELQGDWR